VAARVHASVLSRAAVRQYEELKQPAPGNAPGSLPGSMEPRRTTSQPDYVLWSEERIKHFQDSLKLRLAPLVAILRIPRLHLEVPMLEGTDELTLSRGVGWIESTAHFGENGNIGIAGRRDGFFRGLKGIKVGDNVDLEGPERTDTYVVEQLQIVSPDDVSVLQPGSKPSLTLVTCYPFYFVGSARQRFIVHASRTGSEPQTDNANEPGSATPSK
jgi:sortase A